MKKITLVAPDGLPVPVSFRRSDKSHNGYAVTVGYVPLELDFDIDGTGRGSVMLGEARHVFYARQLVGEIELWIDGQTWRFEMFDDTARRAGAEAAIARSDVIAAPMPGTILEIRAPVGAAFEAHEAVIIMESMKMEMTLAVPHAGRVKKILCEVGQLVERGAILAELEEEEEEVEKAGDARG